MCILKHMFFELVSFYQPQTRHIYICGSLKVVLENMGFYPMKKDSIRILFHNNAVRRLVPKQESNLF